MKKSAIACGYITLNLVTSQKKAIFIIADVRTSNSS